MNQAGTHAHAHSLQACRSVRQTLLLQRNHSLCVLRAIHIPYPPPPCNACLQAFYAFYALAA